MICFVTLRITEIMAFRGRREVKHLLAQPYTLQMIKHLFREVTCLRASGWAELGFKLKFSDLKPRVFSTVSEGLSEGVLGFTLLGLGATNRSRMHTLFLRNLQSNWRDLYTDHCDTKDGNKQKGEVPGKYKEKSDEEFEIYA